MKIAVIGAGVIGVATAYELARDGHEITVFERRGAAAEESSFANAGLVAPGYVTPWAVPGMPFKVIQRVFSRFSAIKVGLPLSGQELAWIWNWYRACNIDTYLAHRTQLQKLAFYSRTRLHQITADLKLEYERSDGYMILLRSERDRKLVQPGLQLLRDAGVLFSELSPLEARQIEPALNPDTSFSGAIYLPDDEVGNCRQFTLILKNEAQRIGVKFSFSTNVTQLNPGTFIAISIAGQNRPQQFDVCVICAGIDSVRLLHPLGLRVPMLAVHGYSISAAIREPLNAPRSAVMDERYKVAISRLGNRVRVAGSAELGGSADKKRTSSLETLYKVLHDWFPGVANMSGGVQEWKGTRPMFANRPPMIGASGISGLWLNLGHGSSGWALSCGSARVLADLLGNKAPDINATGFKFSDWNS
jgi:D-amino-acid dehydrogenase